MNKKTLAISFHGLGDHIILTPVLRRYKELYPNVYIGLTYLERLPVPDLMRSCFYIDEWIPVSDAWNSYESFEIGYKAVLEEAKTHARNNDYDEIIPITMSPSLGITHKVHRAAHELGLAVSDYKTQIFPKITDDVRAEADKFLEAVEEPYVFLHLKTGNPPKDINKDIVANFLSNVSPMQTIEYGSKSIPAHHLPLGNIPLEMEILSRCSKAVCADSFIMHAACALGIPTVAIFTVTPPEWVVPLHSTDIDIYRKV